MFDLFVQLLRAICVKPTINMNKTKMSQKLPAIKQWWACGSESLKWHLATARDQLWGKDAAAKGFEHAGQLLWMRTILPPKKASLEVAPTSLGFQARLDFQPRLWAKRSREAGAPWFGAQRGGLLPLEAHVAREFLAWGIIFVHQLLRGFFIEMRPHLGCFSTEIG